MTSGGRGDASRPASHELPAQEQGRVTCLLTHPCPHPPCYSRCCSIIRESAWQLELKGDLTRQRRLEAIDKLMSVLTLVVAAIFGVQALGLDVNSGAAVRSGCGLW